jgi:hypothetical protein
LASCAEQHRARYAISRTAKCDHAKIFSAHVLTLQLKLNCCIATKQQVNNLPLPLFFPHSLRTAKASGVVCSPQVI